MNIEQRIQAALEQEAEHLQAPYGSPETAIRRGRRRRASNLIGGAALVLTLVGGTAAGVQLLGSGDDPVQAVATQTTETNGDRTSVATSLDVVDFAWERVSLPVPEGTAAWNIQVAADEDGFTAVGIGDPVGQILVWRSPDGTDWRLASASSPFEGSVDSILPTGGGFVAIVRSFDGTSDRTAIYHSADALTWTRGDVDLALAPAQYMWFQGAATGNGATVLGGTLQTELPQPPIVLEDAGVVLQQSTVDGSFTVSRLGSDEPITVVDSAVFYGDGAGLSLYADDGRLLLQVSYEEIDQAEAGIRRDGSVLTVEKDGVRLSLDDADYTYQATDLATGDPIASGSQEELFLPARIRITDPATGEIIVDIDSDEFRAAQETSWNTNDYGHVTSELLVLVTDGDGRWERAELDTGDAEEFNVAGVGFGPAGFVVSVNRYGPTSFGQEVWRSSDGTTWERSSTSEMPGDGAITVYRDEYYRLSYGRTAGVSRSPDGVTWTTVHQADRPGLSYNWLATGELGIVAIGQFQEDAYGPPIVLAKDGRTLVVDGQTGRITVTDDATGEVLTVIELDVYDLDPPEQIITDLGSGTITVTDASGTPLMEFTEEEANAASSAAGPDYEMVVPEPAVAFSSDGDTWFTATTVGLDLAWPSAAAVGDRAVVVAGEPIEAYAEAVYGSDGQVTLGDGSLETATTLVLGDYVPPETYLWVGRPR